MNTHIFHTLRRIVCVVTAFFFITNSTVSYAQVAGQMPWMPKPGDKVELSGVFTPAYLKGMAIHPNEPFKFDFIINRGDEPLSGDAEQAEYQKLIKYFLAALATPDTDQWVNLSPYEKDRVIADNFGLTEMGRDVLAQDYLLKQLSASMTDPRSALGQKFWDGVYAQAHEKFGTTEIPTDVFNKIWIVPDKAVVYEKNNTMIIGESHLKVMTEADYLAMKHNASEAIASAPESAATPSEVAQVSLQVMREVIIPAIEKEVNEGKSFAPLRQVFSGMLLATWYKMTLKQTILGKLYADKSKVKGIDQDPAANQEIYKQYVSAFQKGVVNMIREDVDRYSQEVIPRKYFSGGFTRGLLAINVFSMDSLSSVADYVINGPLKGLSPDQIVAGVLGALGLTACVVLAVKLKNAEARAEASAALRRHMESARQVARNVIEFLAKRTLIRGRFIFIPNKGAGLRVSEEVWTSVAQSVPRSPFAKWAQPYTDLLKSINYIKPAEDKVRIMDPTGFVRLKSFIEIVAGEGRISRSLSESIISTAQKYEKDARGMMGLNFFRSVMTRVKHLFSKRDPSGWGISADGMVRYTSPTLFVASSKPDTIRSVWGMKDRAMSTEEVVAKLIGISKGEGEAAGKNVEDRQVLIRKEIGGLSSSQLYEVSAALKASLEKKLRETRLPHGDMDLLIVGMLVDKRLEKQEEERSRTIIALEKKAWLLDKETIQKMNQDPAVPFEFQYRSFETDQYVTLLQKAKVSGGLIDWTRYPDAARVLLDELMLKFGSALKNGYVHVSAAVSKANEVHLKKALKELSNPGLNFGSPQYIGAGVYKFRGPGITQSMRESDILQHISLNVLSIAVKKEGGSFFVTFSDAAAAGGQQGGIDFAESNLDMQIKRDGAGIVLPIEQQDLQNIRIDGLVPVILDIQPAAASPIFAGLRG